MLILAGLALAVGGALVAPELAVALGGDEFAGGGAPLRILLVRRRGRVRRGLLGHALIARDLQLARAVAERAPRCVLNVALNAALVPAQGIEAAAWIGARLRGRSCWRGSAALVRRPRVAPGRRRARPRACPRPRLMAAAVWPLRTGPLWLSVPVGAAVYALALAGLRVQRRLPAGSLRG